MQHTRATAERTARVGGPGQRHLEQSEINQRLIAAAGKARRSSGSKAAIRSFSDAAAKRRSPWRKLVCPSKWSLASQLRRDRCLLRISLTHRDHASAVALITGHEDPTKPESALAYDQLARFPGTLVFYMGLHRIEQITSSLIEAGRPLTESAAVVCQATTPRQQVVTGDLSTIAGIAHAAKAAAASHS